MSESNGDPFLQWIRQPLQGRSRRSLQRLLDAAEEILREKSFTEMTVNNIVRRARSSVGVFYSRFPNKLALLHHLDERFTADAEETFRGQLDPARWRGRSRAEVSAEVVRFLYDLHERDKGLLRAIILQVRLAPNERFQQTGRRLSQLIDRLAEFLSAVGDSPPGPAARPAIRLALVMLIASIRDVVVFDETTHHQQLLGRQGAELRAAFTGAFHRLLGIPVEE